MLTAVVKIYIEGWVVDAGVYIYTENKVVKTNQVERASNSTNVQDGAVLNATNSGKNVAFLECVDFVECVVHIDSIKYVLCKTCSVYTHGDCVDGVDSCRLCTICRVCRSCRPCIL